MESADSASKAPTAAELERNLVLMKQDLSEVKVGPDFSEDKPDAEEGDKTVSKEPKSVEDVEESLKNAEEDTATIESQSECASSIPDSETISSVTASSHTEATILSMLPDDMSDVVEEPNESKHIQLEKKIKQMKKFLSGTLKKRKDVALSVRKSMENPGHTPVTPSSKRKKINKRKRNDGKDVEKNLSLKIFVMMYF